MGQFDSLSVLEKQYAHLEDSIDKTISFDDQMGYGKP